MPGVGSGTPDAGKGQRAAEVFSLMALGRGARAKSGSLAERGANLVEFSIAVSLFLVLVFGVIEIGKAWYDEQSVTQGVREAARQGIVANYGGGFSECGSLGPGDAVACQAVQRIGLCGVAANVSSGAAEIGAPLTVDARLADYQAMTGLFSSFLDGRTLESSVTMRIENYPDPSAPIDVSGSYSSSCG